jgi:hypothetical protein
VNIVRGVEIDRIDLVAVDEARKVDDLRAFDLQGLQLLVADQHILIAVMFVSLGDLRPFDDLARLAVDQLLLQPVAGLRVDLVEADALRLGRRR